MFLWGLRRHLNGFNWHSSHVKQNLTVLIKINSGNLTVPGPILYMERRAWCWWIYFHESRNQFTAGLWGLHCKWLLYRLLASQLLSRFTSTGCLFSFNLRLFYHVIRHWIRVVIYILTEITKPRMLHSPGFHDRRARQAHQELPDKELTRFKLRQSKLA